MRRRKLRAVGLALFVAMNAYLFLALLVGRGMGAGSENTVWVAGVCGLLSMFGIASLYREISKITKEESP